MDINVLKKMFDTYHKNYKEVIPLKLFWAGIDDYFYYNLFVEHLIEKVKNNYIVKNDFEFNLVASYYNFNYLLCVEYANRYDATYPLCIDATKTDKLFDTEKLMYVDVLNIIDQRRSSVVQFTSTCGLDGLL